MNRETKRHSFSAQRNHEPEFYTATSRHVIGTVLQLPQANASTGGSGRPPNSYGILREDHSILFDAPFSWTLDGIQQLFEDGFPPKALVLSHRDLATSGDAFDIIRDRWNLPILLHPADQRTEAGLKSGINWTDPTTGEGAAILDNAELDLIHIPGHSPGSIMLYDFEAGGILLAGDAAVGPGPMQTDQTPRLERPIGADKDPAFVEIWRKTISALPIAAVLPLHGRFYRAESHDNFAEIVAKIWTGAPMDPRHR